MHLDGIPPVIDPPDSIDLPILSIPTIADLPPRITRHYVKGIRKQLAQHFYGSLASHRCRIYTESMAVNLAHMVMHYLDLSSKPTNPQPLSSLQPFTLELSRSLIPTCTLSASAPPVPYHLLATSGQNAEKVHCEPSHHVFVSSHTVVATTDKQPQPLPVCTSTSSAASASAPPTSLLSTVGGHNAERPPIAINSSTNTSTLTAASASAPSTFSLSVVSGHNAERSCHNSSNPAFVSPQKTVIATHQSRFGLSPLQAMRKQREELPKDDYRRWDEHEARTVYNDFVNAQVDMHPYIKDQLGSVCGHINQQTYYRYCDIDKASPIWWSRAWWRNLSPSGCPLATMAAHKRDQSPKKNLFKSPSNRRPAITRHYVRNVRNIISLWLPATKTQWLPAQLVLDYLMA
jgi:hypothetical protein